MSRYFGELPTQLGQYVVPPGEMMFYQYLPIKFSGYDTPAMEPRLQQFTEIVTRSCLDFVSFRGLGAFKRTNIYLTAKRLFQFPNTMPFNRPGWHSDGFMTDDINYVWCDMFPTVYNKGMFNLTMDDKLSMKEMEEQALLENNVIYPDNTLIRLDQYNIHKVGEVTHPAARTFVKVSFSDAQYDLLGNAHNYLFNYDWAMRERNTERNIPQSI